MAGCGGAASCSCLITGGDGIDVQGSGTQSNPYVITADLPDFSEILQVRDTNTVNMSLFGSGTVADPFRLQADVALKVKDLVDIADPSGGPSAGETLVWVGSPSAGHWEFQVPPPSPAGAVNASGGLLGIGSSADPLRVAVSGVWGTGPLADLGTDTTIGAEIYVDAVGKLRSRPLAASAITWDSISKKPATFTPSSHTHAAADISAAEQLKLNVGKINGKRLYTTPGSAVPPTSPAPALGDVWVYS